MINQPIPFKEREEALNQAQGELLEVLLQPEEDCYPWNPAEPEAEAYFAELERGFLLDSWQDSEEIQDRARGLFEQLDQCWASPAALAIDPVTSDLVEQFATFVPQVKIEAIVRRAQQAVAEKLSLVEQLVSCVNPLLPHWAEEDLLVLARPWAYAMRGNPDTLGEVNLRTTRAAEWSELSQMEQARLSLAIARCAIAQLQQRQG